jgi:hypothetical protein
MKVEIKLGGELHKLRLVLRHRQFGDVSERLLLGLLFRLGRVVDRFLLDLASTLFRPLGSTAPFLLAPALPFDALLLAPLLGFGLGLLFFSFLDRRFDQSTAIVPSVTAKKPGALAGGIVE